MYSLRITLANLLARGAHLAFFLIVGNRLGANTGTDTVFLLYAPLAVISSVGAGVAETVVMPVLHRAMKQDCSTGLHWWLAGRLLTIVIPAGFVAMLMGVVLAKGAPYATVTLLTPVPALATLGAVLSATLNAYGRHLSSVLGPFWGGGGATIVVFLGSPNSTTLASALLVFELGRLVGLSASLPGSVWTMSVKQELVHEYIDWAVRRGLLQGLGSLIAALNPLIAVFYAREFGPGAVTSVEYAGRLWNLVYALFFGHLLMAYVVMSRQAATGCLMSSYVHRQALRFGGVAIVLTIMGVLASRSIVELLYGNGKMEPAILGQLGSLLGFYLIGTAPYIMGMIYVRALSAKGHTGVMTLVAIFGVLLFALANNVLSAWIGLDGIGVANSVVQFLSLILLFVMFRRRFQ